MMKLRRKCVVSVCMLAGVMGFGQTTKPAISKYPATLWVPCDEKQTRIRTIKSPFLVAKASRYWARVKVVSEPYSCENTTTLTIGLHGNAKVVHVERPVKQEDLDGNGMNLVDWSPDGRLLLAEFWRWTQAPNDAGVDKNIWVVPTDHRPVMGVETEQFLTDQEGKSCNLDFDLLGFTPEGEVALRVNISHHYEVDETPADVPPEKRCVEKHELWAVDAATQHRRRLPVDYRVARYSSTVVTMPKQ